MLPALSERGALYAHRHTGFWKSMDTYKDQVELNRLADEGGSPWLSKPATRV
jgi:glucose-1-phosphate cytidylyltransferase